MQETNDKALLLRSGWVYLESLHQKTANNLGLINILTALGHLED